MCRHWKRKQKVGFCVSGASDAIESRLESASCTGKTGEGKHDQECLAAVSQPTAQAKINMGGRQNLSRI